MVEALFARIVGFLTLLEWGMVHILAGVLTVGPALDDDLATYFGNIYPGLTPKQMKIYAKTQWPAFANRVLLQHGINLGWVGVWALMCCFFFVKPTRTLWILCLAPFLFDVGYFIGIDLAPGQRLGELAGEVQTFVVSTGLFCAAYTVGEIYPVSDLERAVAMLTPAALYAAALANKLGEASADL